MKKMSQIPYLIILLVVSLMLSACSSDDKKSDTAEGAYELAKTFEKEERYEEAIKRYQEIRNKFPYSKYALLAELSVADAHFKQESYLEAQVAYQSFKDLHPKHPQIDYVTFRLADSFYRQLPESVDRDLTLASSAILYFDEVVTQYPNSAQTKEAIEKKEAALKMLAEKEKYIADFYFKNETYDSALSRYEGLYSKYETQGYGPVALKQAAICAFKLGERDKAKKYLSDLTSKFPNSDEAAAAKSALSTL